jgi:aryl-alcohol dehydrogenase-like predicted oxidoreductase
MRYRALGQTGVLCSQLALGVSLFGRRGYHVPAEEAVKILDGYLEAGGNVVDTSSRYRFGESEETLGALLGARRDGVVLCTKYSRGDRPDPALTEVGASRKTMVQSVERSLRRLRTDRVDVLFVHMDDRVTPVEEILRGFEDLISAGKILYGGLSNYPAWRTAYGVALAAGRGWAALSSVQVEYSALQRTPEREILPMAEAIGLGVLAWSPLAGGLLTGKYRRGETVRAQSYAEGMPEQDAGPAAAVITEVIAVAGECGATPGQVALAWLLARGVLPVIGPRTPAQLADNLGAASLSLPDGLLQRIDAVSAIPLGYPHELTSSLANRAVNTGGHDDLMDLPARPVA